jgi:subtilisin family serine protease
LASSPATTPAALPWAVASQPTAGPLLDPDDPGVDATRLVAVPKTGVTTNQVLEQVKGKAQLLPSPSGVIEPADSASSVVVVATNEADSAKVANQMVRSGLYEAVDYEVMRYTHANRLPNDPFFAAGAPQAPFLYGLTSGPGGSHFDEAWLEGVDLDSSSNLVPMAWIDSGYILTHPEFGSNIEVGYDYGEGDTDVSPTPPDPDEDHGAMTLSVAAARADNGIGGLGGSWNARARLYKVATKTGSMPSSALAAAIRDAADRGIKVVNMSLGGPGTSSVETNAVRYAFERDVNLIASAGNSGDEMVDGVMNPVEYPAAFPEVISVGATDLDGKPCPWSTHNNMVDVAAAGEDVLVASDAFVGGYEVASGTSFSAPLVAAAVNLLLRQNPGLSPTQVKMILTETAMDVTSGVGKQGRDDYTGAGIVNARAAVEKAPTVPLMPTISSTHSAVTVAAGESVSLEVTASGYPMPQVSFDPGSPIPLGFSVTTQGNGIWQVAGSSTAPGVYETRLVANAAGRIQTLPLTITIVPGPAASFTFDLPAAMRNSTVLNPIAVARDAFGNVTTTATPVTYTYSINPGCRFKKGSKPSYRRCTVTAQTSAGVVAQRVIDVYDTSKFTKPKVVGKVKAGRKLKASIPKGWKHLTYQWYKNGKAIKGATARTYKLPKKVSAKAKYKVRVAIPSVTSKTSKQVKVRK